MTHAKQVDRNAPIPADLQAEHAERHGLGIDDAGRVIGPTGDTCHDVAYRDAPAGFKVDYEQIPDALHASIAGAAAIDDHCLPPHVDTASPEAIEYDAARVQLSELEAQLNDLSGRSPSQNELAEAHARYNAAEEWRQHRLADHRHSVQLAHGIPIGDDQVLGAPPVPQTEG